ncbi:hypothetical protein like AT1G62935 [Hibiscus trionum]|uniref:Uncharacterized protein n=1 Tax=Hibiscus trionum TaxID=183268 RepID=A0A9W7IY47_HIBTR|nr:hypothetical protein like AT1G62935 [Hibiscus trionum]
MKLFCSTSILSALTLLFLKSLSTCNLEFSYNPLSLFLLFNAIILSVIVVSHKRSTYEFDGVCSASEVGASFDHIEQSSHISDGYYEDDTGISDGYYEDDTGVSDGYYEDDDDSRYVTDEEYEDDLHQRIEDFIAKVNNGWREEWLSEKDCEQPWMG